MAEGRGSPAVPQAGQCRQPGCENLQWSLPQAQAQTQYFCGLAALTWPSFSLLTQKLELLHGHVLWKPPACPAHLHTAPVIQGSPMGLPLPSHSLALHASHLHHPDSHCTLVAICLFPACTMDSELLCCPGAKPYSHQEGLNHPPPNLSYHSAFPHT